MKNGGTGQSHNPFSPFSCYRHQHLCTVSSRTRSFSPPSPSSPGPWAMPPQPSPHSLSPHALPAGSVGCQSPQVSSSHPDSALTLESRCSQLYQWKWGRGIAVGNGKKGLRGFGTPCIHFRTPHGNVSGVWHWQNGGKNRNTGHDSLAPRFSGIRYSHTRQEPSAPVRGFLLYLQKWYLSLPPGESAPGTLPTDTGPKP